MLWPDVCVVFDCSSLDSFTVAHFDALCAEIGGLCHIRMFFHSDGDFGFDRKNVIRLTSDQILREVRHAKDVDRGVIPGNPDLKLIRGMREIPEIKFVIRLEYDVICTQEIRTAFNWLISVIEGSDFSASFFYEKNEITQKWVWWDTLRVPEGCGVAPSFVPRSAFLPLLGVSADFMRAYEAALAAGLAGHYEVAMPTFAAAKGFRMLDLAAKSIGATSLPQFNAIAVHDSGEAPPMFVHPIKSLSDLNRLRLRPPILRSISAT